MKQKPMQRQPISCPAGFTLMELLIVIVIIAVLAAIGFPLARNMRASAERTQCMTQLRAWGVAMAGYAADNDGKVNWEHWPSIGTNPLEYSPYVSYWTGDSSDLSGFDTQLMQRNCPAVKYDKTKGNSPVTYATIRPVGVNGVGISGRRDKGLSSDYSLAKITNTNRFMLMIDATGAGYYVSSSDDFNKKVKPLTVNGPDLRHNHQVNALFADFSIRSMSWKEVEKGLKYWSTF